MVHYMWLISALIAAKEPTYKFELHKAADSVIVQKEKERTVLVFTSKSGIGGADIVLAKGAWPEKVTLRFRYSEGNAFWRLEDIRLYSDRVLIQGAQNMSGKMPFCFMGPDGMADAIEPGGSEAAGYLDVRVARKDAGMDVTLPAHLLTGSSKFRVSWIDAYRR